MSEINEKSIEKLFKTKNDYYEFIVITKLNHCIRVKDCFGATVFRVACHIREMNEEIIIILQRSSCKDAIKFISVFRFVSGNNKY